MIIVIFSMIPSSRSTLKTFNHKEHGVAKPQRTQNTQSK